MNDELDRDDLDAWEVEPLGEGFEDRVLAAWDEERVEPRPSTEPSRTWIPIVAFAAAAALVALLWPRAESEPTVAIRPGVSARLEHVRGAREAVQRAGTVEYEVPSGTPFVVHTPAADVSVHGTAFTVEVLNMNDPIRSKYLGAGALALTGAAVAVYVTSGDVEVRNEHGAVQLNAGQTAVASEHAAPRAEPTKRKPEPKATPRPRATKKISKAEREDVRRRIRAALRARDEAPEPRREEPVDREPPAALAAEYIQEVVAEDLVPIAKECYESALEDAPDLGGRLMLQFSIVGDASVGGIVDEVTIDEEASTLKHPSLSECMTESTASLLFDPPEDGGRIVVTYPFNFEPGEAPAD